MEPELENRLEEIEAKVANFEMYLKQLGTELAAERAAFREQTQAIRTEATALRELNRSMENQAAGLQATITTSTRFLGAIGVVGTGLLGWALAKLFSMNGRLAAIEAIINR